MKKRQQVAALPWRHGKGGIEVLLVTTRTTRRWVVPKGWRMPGTEDADAAAIEAFEEAGVRGRISHQPFGQFAYLKVLGTNRTREVEATVYALQVTQELVDWPERRQRVRRWHDAATAASLVSDPGLATLITAFAAGFGTAPIAEVHAPEAETMLGKVLRGLGLRKLAD